MFRTFCADKVIRHLTQRFAVRCTGHSRFFALGIAALTLGIPLTAWAIGIPTLVQDLTPVPYQAGFALPDNTLLDDKMISANGLLFFVAQDAVNSSELWKSDATITGTTLVKDIYAGTFGSNPKEFTRLNGTLFFAADDGSSGQELWKTDGTLAGTVQVKDIRPGSQSSSLRNLTVVNGSLFFSVDDEGNGTELWKSDGTEVGTTRIKALFPLLPFGPNLSDFTAVNDRLFFTAADGTSGHELWTSDGTETGTRLVSDITPGADGSWPLYLTAGRGTFFLLSLMTLITRYGRVMAQWPARCWSRILGKILSLTSSVSTRTYSLCAGIIQVLL